MFGGVKGVWEREVETSVVCDRDRPRDRHDPTSPGDLLARRRDSPDHLDRDRDAGPRRPLDGPDRRQYPRDEYGVQAPLVPDLLRPHAH